MKQLELTTEESRLNALQKQSTTIAEQCLKLTVNDETTLAIATQNLSKANGIVKEIDSLRTDLKKPYLDAGRQIDAIAKSLSQPIEKAIEAGKKKILGYQAEQKKKQIEEANRILAIKNAIIKYTNDTIAALDKCTTIEQLTETRERLIVNAPMELWQEFMPDFMKARVTLNDYAKSRRTIILTPQEADEEESVMIAQAAQEVQIEIPTETKVQGIRKTWKFEVQDLSKCPIEWLTINESVLKNFISENKGNLKDDEIIAGIRFYQEESLTIR